MAQPQPVSCPRIVRKAGVVGGEPTIGGTRISVRIIAQAYEQDPNIDAMLEDYPMLDREAIELPLMKTLQLTLHSRRRTPRAPLARRQLQRRQSQLPSYKRYPPLPRAQRRTHGPPP